MNFHWLQALRAFILLLFSAFIFMLHHTGDIGRFINPEYVVFSQIASVIFLFLFFIQVPRIWRDPSLANEDHSNCGPWGCNHDDGYNQGLSLKTVVSYSIILIPLVTGFLLPGKDLDASIASKRGLFISSTPHTEEENVSCNEENNPIFMNKVTDERQTELLNNSLIILDASTFASRLQTISQAPHLYKGKRVQLEGFALRDETLEGNYWVIARFLVTHCVADASVIGVLVQIDDNVQLTENSWVRVQGVLQVGTHNESMVPLVEVDKLQLIRQPKEPYVYPSKEGK